MASQTPTPAQAAATPLKVARAIFDALSKKDLDTLSQFHTDETVDDFVAIGEIWGKTFIRLFFEELFAAFPDFEITADRTVADRSTAMVQWHATGTFSGRKYQGIEPTGRHVETRGVDVMDHRRPSGARHDLLRRCLLCSSDRLAAAGWIESG